MSLPPECSLEATPLPVCFAQAQAAYHWVDGSSLGGADPALQQRVADGLAFAEKAAELVSSLSVFSANEELEDINTGDLKYLLLPFLRAELILRIQPEEAAGCHDVRLKHLRHAAALLEAFLRDLEARRALRAEARAGWEEACADRPLDAAASRTLKVSRLRAASRAKKARHLLLAGVGEEREASHQPPLFARRRSRRSRRARAVRQQPRVRTATTATRRQGVRCRGGVDARGRGRGREGGDRAGLVGQMWGEGKRALQNTPRRDVSPLAGRSACSLRGTRRPRECRWETTWPEFRSAAHCSGSTMPPPMSSLTHV